VGYLPPERGGICMVLQYLPSLAPRTTVAGAGRCCRPMPSPPPTHSPVTTACCMQQQQQQVWPIAWVVWRPGSHALLWVLAEQWCQQGPASRATSAAEAGVDRCCRRMLAPLRSDPSYGAMSCPAPLPAAAGSVAAWEVGKPLFACSGGSMRRLPYPPVYQAACSMIGLSDSCTM
jgi:hypothetical protein